VLFMENDWVWVKPFPFDLFDRVCRDSNVWYLRTYGKYKELSKHGTPMRPSIDNRHSGLRGYTVKWHPYTDCSEIGWIHPSNSGAKRTDLYMDLLSKCDTHAQTLNKSGYIQEKTVRVKDNIIWHIGAERTPEFRK
jgi:hypothetical protein